MNETSGDGSSRLAHEQQVLQVLRRTPEVSQPALALEAGLARGTVVSIIRRLEEKALVDTTQKSSPGPEGGRPGKVVRFQENAGFALSVHFGHRHVRVASGNLRGYEVFFLEEESVAPAIETEVDVGANEEESLEVAVRLAREALRQNEEKYNRGLHDLVAVTVGWPAPVRNPLEGEVVIDGSMEQWLAVGPPAKKLESLLGWSGVPFLIENDANLGAVMELEHGVGREHSDFLYVHWNSGIGAAMVSDHQLRRGGTGLAGEVGHIPLPDEESARRCRRCHSEHCLEALAGGMAVVERFNAKGPHQVESLREVIRIAQEGQRGAEEAREVLTDAARLVGKALGPLVTTFNPTAIVIGGHFGQDDGEPNPYNLIDGAFRSSLREHVSPRALRDVRVTGSSRWRYGAAQGGVVLGLRRKLPEFVEMREVAKASAS